MTKYRDPKTGQYVNSPAKRKQALINELYRAFDFFNESFADNKLPKCIITIQNKGRKSAYGWFSYSRWSDSLTDKGIPEINISAEYASNGSYNILETLLHEMAHFWNAEKGIDDCSGNQYHNKQFKVAAELFGLKVTRDTRRGWAYTALTDDSRKAIMEFKPDYEAFKFLKRRENMVSQHKKYTSLIVNTHVGEQVKETAQSRGVSQRELVEEALIDYLSTYQ
jgi:hypothetical protein